MKITKFTCENLVKHCVTDNSHPIFSYTVSDDRQGAFVKKAVLEVNGWSCDAINQIAIKYEGKTLTPFTEYEAKLYVEDDQGGSDTATCTFMTGRMNTPWNAKWITDGKYVFTEKKVSPKPMDFAKVIPVKNGKKLKRGLICATAMGIYEASVNGKKVGDIYFAPGFTSYKSRLQYQIYDITDMLDKDVNRLSVTVAGGWAVGSFVFTRKNRITADRQALLMEVILEYEDGALDVIGTNDSWSVTTDSRHRMADLYDGETFDASSNNNDGAGTWHNASYEKLRVEPSIFAQIGAPVKAHERFKPISSHKYKDGMVYDFGQNMAAVVELDITRARDGQEIVVRHSEILNTDGGPNTTFLRSAKATVTYICREGAQVYSPKFTYMGFRYIWVRGIEPTDYKVSAIAIYSDVERIGSFECDNERINKLQSNITWSAKSNFVDIPTDCPQRDERMGWTGDIAVFANTACYNFDMARFLKKWLADVREEQLPTGGIPNTVPSQGYGFPATMPVMAVEFWGDACILVPWALYMSTGDIDVLKDNFNMMKKYVNACKRWAGLLSFGKHRYLWNTPSVLHFGDWVAADSPKMSQWQKRTKWTATASLCNTSHIVSKVAGILGFKDDEAKYENISRGAMTAYNDILTDGNGKLKEEFQTAYVLPLYFNMFAGEARENAVANLVRLVEKNNYCIGTGFPGTPYILFALADNGREDVALKMLLNDKCPSWLHEVKMGATTIWERWDGLNEDGVCPISDDGTDMMISYNHYASGAVGDFLYRRIAGIEPTAPGYKRFMINPLISKEIKHAKGVFDAPYGRIVSDWKVLGDKFVINVSVPVGCECELHMPDGSIMSIGSGKYERKCVVNVG
jgi:alpha-L-rhamnosidase